MNVGIALSTFLESPSPLVEMAQQAEFAGIDGVFVYDHLIGFDANGAPRASIECTTLLAAIAHETSNITLGSLVLRAGTRGPGMNAHMAASVHALAPDRLIVGIGAGDHQSRKEDEMFGLPERERSDRDALVAATATAIRARGIPAWVGGRGDHAQAVAARYANGLNVWGAPADEFGKIVADTSDLLAADREQDGEEPFCFSWAGLMDLDDEGAQQLDLGHNNFRLSGSLEDMTEQIRPILEHDPGWIMFAPLPPHGERAVERVRELQMRVQNG